MDTTKAITHVSLCAGYGGIDLGLKRAIPSLRTIAFSEIEAFACANLVAKMEAGLLDPAPIWTDLKTFPWSDFRDRVDILSGGYPCQPFSAAGKRLGAEDPRHLWPHISAGIALMRPSVCFFENVEGHISLGLSDVIEDLGRLGYRATWCVASASECGAPHQRKRIFILAYDQSLRIQGRWPSWIEESRPHAGQALPVRGGDAGGEQWPSRPGEQQFAWEPPRVVADSKKSGRISQRIAGDMDGEVSPEGSRGHQLAPTIADCGDAGASEDPRLPNAQDVRLEEQSECGQQHQADGSGPSNPSGVCPCEAQEGRSVEHASDWSNGEQPTEQQGRHSVGGSGEEGAMGNATSEGPQERSSRSHDSPIQAAQCGSGSEGNREAQSPLGRDADGPADWLDHAELYVTYDNRTDELRLLGNGVVVACAERAFRLLVGELMEDAQ